MNLDVVYPIVVIYRACRSGSPPCFRIQRTSSGWCKMRSTANTVENCKAVDVDPIRFGGYIETRSVLCFVCCFLINQILIFYEKLPNVLG